MYILKWDPAMQALVLFFARQFFFPKKFFRDCPTPVMVDVVPLTTALAVVVAVLTAGGAVALGVPGETAGCRSLKEKPEQTQSTELIYKHVNP